MRPPLLALGAAGALAIIATACGGGGSHTSPLPAASSAATDPNPNMTVSNTNGPTGTMTITLKVPKTTPAGAAMRAQIKKFGPKHANARIRQLANTSPSATIRAAGQQRNAYAKKVQESTGRTPAFIDGNTDLLELVVSDSSNDQLFDTTQTCSLSAGQCTATFTVPAGSNLTVSLLTYDSCDYLLAAGSISGLTINTGVNSPQTITLNGVAAYFGLISSAAPFVADVAGTQAQPSFTVTAQPIDADNNIIQTPGTVIDESYFPIQSVNISALAIDNASFVEQFPTTVPSSNVSPGTQSVNVTGATVAPATFAYSGTGSDVNEVFQVSENATGTPVLPNVFIGGPFGCCSVPAAGPSANNPPIGQLQSAVTPALAWSYQGGANNNPSVAGPTSFGLWIAQFPTVAPQTSVNFIALSNLPGFNGTISLGDDAETGCSAFTPTPSESASPIAYAGESSTGYSFDFNTANTTCQFIATDDFGNSANLEMAVDSTNITVQRKARKH